MEIWLTENVWWLWLPVITVVAGLGYSAKRYFDTPARRARRKARQLFQELCRVHRLESRAVRMLRQLATGNELPHPALIFIRPDLFQAAQLPEALSHRADVVEQLHARLFVARD